MFRSGLVIFFRPFRSFKIRKRVEGKDFVQVVLFLPVGFLLFEFLFNGFNVPVLFHDRSQRRKQVYLVAKHICLLFSCLDGFIAEIFQKRFVLLAHQKTNLLQIGVVIVKFLGYFLQFIFLAKQILRRGLYLLFVIVVPVQRIVVTLVSKRGA